MAEQVTLLRTPRAVNGPLRIGWLAPDGSDVEAGAPVIRFDATDMEKELHEGQANRSKADSRMTKQRVEQETASQNLQRDADLAGQQLEHAREFQNDDAELFSRIAIIESEIDSTLATERRDHATATMTRREGLGSVELDLLALERQRADLTIERAEAGLAQLEVTAPHDGIFVLSRDRGDIAQVGQSIWPGQPIAEIPQLDSMKADVFVLEADAGGIGVGKRASVVLEAHPDVEFDAVVRRVSAVAKRRTRFSPVQYFDVELELDRTDPALMKPGQRVRAVLEVERLDDVLSIPREAVFQSAAGASFVYRRAGSGFEKVEVELGATALGRVVVAAGVEAGDVVALEDPERASRDDEQDSEANGSGSGPLPAGESD